MTNYAWTLITIGLLAALGVIAAVTVYVYGSHEQAATVIGLAFAFLAPTITSLLALAKSHDNSAKLDSVTHTLKTHRISADPKSQQVSGVTTSMREPMWNPSGSAEQNWP